MPKCYQCWLGSETGAIVTRALGAEAPPFRFDGCLVHGVLLNSRSRVKILPTKTPRLFRSMVYCISSGAQLDHLATICLWEVVDSFRYAASLGCGVSVSRGLIRTIGGSTPVTVLLLRQTLYRHRFQSMADKRPTASHHTVVHISLSLWLL